MAKAVVIPPTYEERKVVHVERVAVKQGVALELTHKECIALQVVLGCVGGDPRTTARKHTDAIQHALDRAGYVWNDVDNDVRSKLGHKLHQLNAGSRAQGSFYFFHDVPDGL